MQIDCCKRPELSVIKILEEQKQSDTRTLFRCGSCGSYWLQDECEYMSFNGDDQWRTSNKMLTAEEAAKELEDPFSVVQYWMA